MKNKKTILFCGPAAVGGSHNIAVLVKNFPHIFKEVKSTTTREPRHGKADHKNYNFLSREEFLKRKGEELFLETDEYLGQLYGTQLKDLDSVLATHHALIKITPRGARAIKERLADRKVFIAILQPLDSATLTRNYRRRYGKGVSEEKVAELRKEADKFLKHMHSEIPTPDGRIVLTGRRDEENEDYQRIRSFLQDVGIPLPKHLKR